MRIPWIRSPPAWLSPASNPPLYGRFRAPDLPPFFPSLPPIPSSTSPPLNPTSQVENFVPPSPTPKEDAEPAAGKV